MKEDTQKSTCEAMATLSASLDAAIAQRNRLLAERDLLNEACAENMQRHTDLTEASQRQLEKMTQERDTARADLQRARALLGAAEMAMDAAMNYQGAAIQQERVPWARNMLLGAASQFRALGKRQYAVWCEQHAYILRNQTDER